MEAQTVLGPVPVDQLGATLMHEHVLVDLTCYWSEPDDPADRELARVKVADVSRYTILGTPVGRTTMMILDNLVLDDVGMAAAELRSLRECGRGDHRGSDPGRDRHRSAAAGATSWACGRCRHAPGFTSWRGPAITSIFPIRITLPPPALRNSPGRW